MHEKKESTMSSPCRRPQDRARKLQRRRALLRGLWRRVVVPTKVVCSFAGIGLFINACWYVDNVAIEVREKERAQAHFDTWQRSIDERQAVIDTKRAALDKREAELNARIRNFDDVISMSPLLVKGTSDTGPFMRAIDRSRPRRRRVTKVAPTSPATSDSYPS